MAKHAWLAAGLIAALTACAAPAPWMKEGAAPADYSRDVSWCRGAAELEVGYLEDDEIYLRDLVYTRTFDRCMRERGWRRKGEGA